MAARKTFSFALVHMTVAFAVGYALTGSWVVGGTLAVVEPACNTVAYYLHERAWSSQVRPGACPTPPVLSPPSP